MSDLASDALANPSVDFERIVGTEFQPIGKPPKCIDAYTVAQRCGHGESRSVRRNESMRNKTDLFGTNSGLHQLAGSLMKKLTCRGRSQQTIRPIREQNSLSGNVCAYDQRAFCQLSQIR